MVIKMICNGTTFFDSLSDISSCKELIVPGRYLSPSLYCRICKFKRAISTHFLLNFLPLPKDGKNSTITDFLNDSICQFYVFSNTNKLKYVLKSFNLDSGISVKKIKDNKFKLKNVLCKF